MEQRQKGLLFVVADCEYQANLIVYWLKHCTTEVAKQFTSVALAS